MKLDSSLRVLADVAESQWGLVTSAQASALGVSYMNLTRLAESGDLVRVAQGVYRDAGAPGGQHEELRAAWLATDPEKLAYQRLNERPVSAVVSGESAVRLHGIGDLRGMRSEFTTPTRRQTQRADVRYRTRVLPDGDVTVREGLPVTTPERTIADLVEDRQDLSIVGGAFRDAARQSRLDVDRLTDLLSPLAARNGHRKGDGETVLQGLLRAAGIDQESIANQLAAIPSLGAAIAMKYIESLPTIDASAVLDVIAKQAVTRPADGRAQVVVQLDAVAWTGLALATRGPNVGSALMHAAQEVGGIEDLPVPARGDVARPVDFA